jgi:rod shape-determining protein MreD
LKLKTALSVLLVVLLQVTINRWLPFVLIDFVLILVVYFALQRDGVQAVIIGALTGLAIDGLSAGSLLGSNGFTKTLVAYTIAALSTRIVLDNPLLRIPVLGGAALMDSMVYVFLHRLFSQPTLIRFVEFASYKLIATTVVGTLLFYVFDVIIGEGADRRRHFAFRRRVARRTLGRR